MLLSYFLTDKYHSTETNPYEEDTRSWHIWIDIATTHGDGPELNVDRMMEHHGMEWDYYQDSLDELVEDGYLQAVYLPEASK